ncbi:hypothetical protein M011DRAFT_278682 [Sporormia fimetaria CBS 119925]|uniref:Uncharacterized protein n=1 Tax=Sporormia fimetaria CBS 119925 TaxID=1340428 RepID=A0A6A6VGX0_9PLEO|nr:hypothetical protein M011DRAFT_278682 [Sporormia fimetaria CBS 119925]
MASTSDTLITIPTTATTSFVTSYLEANRSSSLVPSSNSTTSSITIQPTVDPRPPPSIFEITPHDPDDPDRQRKEGVFNYYFLILAGFGCLIAIGLWWIRRRRKRRKLMLRLSGQNALAQDLDGWSNTRRWMRGFWRAEQPAIVRPEEGLNEHGEAPPPYQPTAPSVTEVSPAAIQDLSNGLTLPERVLSTRRAEAIQPPQYEELHNPNASTRLRPAAGSSHGGARSSQGG